MLARYLGTTPEAVQITHGEHGKPRLEGTGDLAFNLSHSGQLAVIALVRGREVGIDVEKVVPDRDFLAIAARAFDEEVVSELRAARAADRAPVFYEAWVRHEARLKCLGVGIGHPAPAQPVAVESIEVGPGYAAAVAIAGEEVGRLRLLA
ncbi:MAG TPA: 4'-phosphopantetheinyl transferase superfamily protein [Solirubrobacterales bacterium]|nr:4'-phosphopantetheinyl transferase superfamily protein [Solirubrobacterales bacterium]